MKKTIFALLFVVVFLAMASFADAAIIKVKVQSANIRQQPDATSAVISRAALGTFFEVIKKTGNWFEIAVTDATGRTVTGFVNADVVEEVGAPAAPAAPRGTAPAPVTYAAPKAAGGGGKFMVMLGPVLSNLASSEPVEDPWKKSFRFGLAAGAGYEMPLGTNLSAVGGLVFSTGGANFSATDESGTYKYSYVANALAVPLYIKYSFNGPFVLAGPYFGFVMSPKFTYDWAGETGEETIETTNMNTFIFGLLVGGGLEMDLGGMKGFAQIVYNLGLSKLNKEGDGSIKPNSINFIFGIKL